MQELWYYISKVVKDYNSTAIIVRGRKDTDKIEYTIIDSGRIAYESSRYREVWDNK